jgi:hypothetical protein
MHGPVGGLPLVHDPFQQFRRLPHLGAVQAAGRGFALKVGACAFHRCLRGGVDWGGMGGNGPRDSHFTTASGRQQGVAGYLIVWVFFFLLAVMVGVLVLIQLVRQALERRRDRLDAAREAASRGEGPQA